MNMEYITLAKALTIKNRMTRKMKSLLTEVGACNLYVSGKTPEIPVKEFYQEACKISDELVKIKTKIEEANLPVRAKIFTLGELKSRLAFLKTLDVNSNTQKQPYLYSLRASVSETKEYSAVIDRAEVNKLLSEIQAEIDNLQDELNTFNSNTTVDVSDICTEGLN